MEMEMSREEVLRWLHGEHEMSRRLVLNSEGEDRSQKIASFTAIPKESARTLGMDATAPRWSSRAVHAYADGAWAIEELTLFEVVMDEQGNERSDGHRDVTTEAAHAARHA